MPQAPAHPALPDEPTDEALLTAYRGGEARALDALIRRYQLPVYRLLLRHLGGGRAQAADAEDLTQRAFLKVLDRLPGLRDDGAFRAWLFRIALNLCRNRHRQRGRWRQAAPELLEEQVDPGQDAEALLGEQRQWRHVQAQIARLPRMQREVVRLRLQAEIPFATIAEVLGSSEASCKVSYHHAVKKLRAALTETGALP